MTSYLLANQSQVDYGHDMNDKDASKILLEKKIKRTKARLSIVKLMSSISGPCTVDTLCAKGKGAFDRATAYRVLSQFSDAGVVRKIDFQQGVVLYEFEHAGSHHHHVVCRDCFAVEDVDVNESGLQKSVLRQTKKFKKISGHTIEFFGICNTCSAS